MESLILVCGPGGVGKSALIIRYIQDHFVSEYDPTIEDSYRKQVTVDGEVRLLNLMDQAGREDYSAFHDQMIRDSESCVVCFAVDNQQSLEEAKQWLQRIRIGRDVEKLDFTILVGNKIDLADKRQVTKEQAESVAMEYGCQYWETSALTSHNVQEVFPEASRLAAKVWETRHPKAAPKRLKGANPQKGSFSSRCMVM